MDFIDGLTDDELARLASRLRPFLHTRAEVPPATPTNSPASEEDPQCPGAALTTATADQQLAVLTDATMQMIDQSAQQVYAAVMTEINTKIVPQISRLTAHAQYTYMDEPEFTTMYRRAAVAKEKQTRGGDDPYLLTDGGASDCTISRFAQKVFGEDD